MKLKNKANDRNSLNQPFYYELLYILGLTEVKQGNKKLIQREKEGNINRASLLENALSQIKSLDKFYRLENLEIYGENETDQLFNLSLELIITWINRILFLKLLEAQLINYHQKDQPQKYSFLNLDKIKNYDDLNCLFFEVLACKIEEREAKINQKWGNIPYLNSSLFEVTEIEHQTIVISNLKNESLPIFKYSVLKDSQGKKQEDSLNSLEYLFNFLSAYDFGERDFDPPQPPLKRGELEQNIPLKKGELEQNIQEIPPFLRGVREDQKSLINASVLGLIFEKINGYKDGSFFTPCFITMYMGRETIRRAVIQKFNDLKNWNCKNIEDLYDKIEDKKEANTIINSLKICDPAVGSGHFLVSALNEIIAIKSELKILIDKNNRTLRDYTITVENDELMIINDDGDVFTYNPNNKESQRVQETLFHEKQTIIENCLFGVDINSNSVKICRLRLWIELLKNAYYRENQIPDFLEKSGIYRQLETLPNIDINIKHGNSLISRFALNSDLKTALKKNNCDIATYQNAVNTYRNAENKAQKREMLKLIESIKSNFSQSLYNTDPKKVKLRKLENELYNLENQLSLLPETVKEKKVREKKIYQLQNEIDKLKIEIEEIERGKLYQNAFEWRFEFPEVLNDQGDFVGFDIIIGNPPYGVSIKGKERDYLIINKGKVPDFEIYYWFINLANSLLKNNGKFSYIIPNSILFNVFAQNYRLELFNNWYFDEILDCTELNIFAEAKVKNIIISLTKFKNSLTLNYKKTDHVRSFQDLINRKLLSIDKDLVIQNNQNWGLLFKLDQVVISLITKIKLNSQSLINYFPETSQGLIAYDKYKNQSAETIKNRIFHSTKKLNDNYKYWLYGEDVTKYNVKWNGKEYINYCDQIANPREPKFFINKRILVREITNPCIFATLTTEEFYHDPAIIIILDPPQGNLSLECLLGILNSKLMTFYHINSSPKATKGAFPKILVYDINNFPLPKNINKNLEFMICQKVNEIIKIKQNDLNVDTSKLEKEIDLFVYKLYDLTEDEIKIVEGGLNIKINKSHRIYSDLID